ncbi:MAG: hypothetical protein C0625_12695 [Arcobacter sp.]|nr:MAG: hypothetical protein C0625_12695 [Arcobacter sp.]
MFEMKNNHLKLFEEFNLENTRDRLIKVAMETFAEKGYTKTSIRQLATKADVNIAAINYHFGGKDGLYQAVLEYIAEYMDSWAVPLLTEYEKFLESQKEVFDSQKALFWLHKFLEVFINTSLDSYESNVLLHKIIAREQLRQTFEFNKIYGYATIKLAEHIISDLLCRISKKSINDDIIIIYTQSIIGQIEVFISVHSTINSKLGVKKLTKEQINTVKKIIINHVDNVILNLK